MTTGSTTRGFAVAVLAGCVIAPTAVLAQDLSWQQGGSRVELQLAGSALVGGSDETLPKRASEPDLLQGYARLTADWTSPAGRIFGDTKDLSGTVVPD